jgi:hypothetical protein
MAISAAVAMFAAIPARSPHIQSRPLREHARALSDGQSDARPAFDFAFE